MTSDPSFRPLVLIIRLAALAEAVADLRQSQQHAAQAAAALRAAQQLRTARGIYAAPASAGQRPAKSAATLAGAGFPAPPARTRPRRLFRHRCGPGRQRHLDPGSSHDASEHQSRRRNLMDTADVYPDLLGDALSYSSQRMAQLVSLVTAAATVEARRKARRNAAKTIRSERELRELQDQERAAYQLARAGWAPARDPRFLDQADLLQAARAWSAAAAYADADPKPLMLSADATAAAVLHPYAMAWYDRLRSDGAAPLDAMREALPLFARAPHARPGDPAAERRGLRPRTVLARHPGTAARTTPRWPRPPLIPPLPGRPSGAVSRSRGNWSPRCWPSAGMR